MGGRNRFIGIPGAKRLLRLPLSLPFRLNEMKRILPASQCHIRTKDNKTGRESNPNAAPLLTKPGRRFTNSAVNNAFYCAGFCLLTHHASRITAPSRITLHGHR
jgi:hypothetical protein